MPVVNDRGGHAVARQDYSALVKCNAPHHSTELVVHERGGTADAAPRSKHPP